MLAYRKQPAGFLLASYFFWALSLVSLSVWWQGAPRWWPGSSKISAALSEQTAVTATTPATSSALSVSTLAWGSIPALVAILIACGLWYWGQRRVEHYLVADADSATRQVTEIVAEQNPFSNADRSANTVMLLTGTLQRALGLSAKAISTVIALVSIPLVVALVIAICYSPWLGLLCLFNAIVAPLAIAAFAKTIRRSTTANQRAGRVLTGRFLDLVRGIDTAAYFQAAEAAGDEIERLAMDSRNRTMQLLAVNQIIIFILDLVMYGWQAGTLLLLGVWLVSAGTLTAAQLVTVIVLATLLLLPIDQAGIFFVAGFGGRTATKQLNQLAADRGGANRYLTPLDAAGEAGSVQAHSSENSEAATSAKSAPTGTASIVPAAVSVSGVSTHYPGSEAEIRSVDFTVAPGEHVLIAGPSGCGKSTLAYLLSGSMCADSGEILIAGQAPGKARVAVVNQRPWVWTASVWENLKLADPQLTRARAEELLQQVGLRDELGEKWAEVRLLEEARGLSGGQAQRLALAQALATNPQLLIADEPTSAIDPRSQELVLQVLQECPATVIHIAHRADVLATGQRVIDFSEVAASGKPAPAAQPDAPAAQAQAVSA